MLDLRYLLICALLATITFNQVSTQDEDEDDGEKPTPTEKSSDDSGTSEAGKTDDSDDPDQSAGSDSVIDEKRDSDDSSSSDTSTNRVPKARQMSKNRRSQLVKQLDNLRERVRKGKQSLTMVVESFMGRGDEMDEKKLEEALEKYDEIVEDVEADFTRAKIAIGLGVEEGLKRYNETAKDFLETFRGLNEEFVEWSNANRAQLLGRLRKRLLFFNDFLSQGVERLLEMSERGKETLRRLYKRRYEKRTQFLDFLRI